LIGSTALEKRGGQVITRMALHEIECGIHCRNKFRVRSAQKNHMQYQPKIKIMSDLMICGRVTIQGRCNDAVAA